MLTYKFTGFLYIPISLNILHIKKKFHLLNGNYLSCEISSKIYEVIIGTDAEIIIVDLKEITVGDSRCFTIFNELFEDSHGKNIIFINFNDKIKSFLTTDCSSFVKFDQDLEAISNNEGISIYRDKIWKNIHAEIAKYIKNSIQKHIRTEECLLKISNVYVNKYIDIKKLFSYPATYYLMLFELALAINKEYGDGFDKLICCSYNGAVVSTIIGQLLNVEVIHLMNLGPSISISNIDMAKKILPNQKYLFIADMICLGTEFSMTKTITKLNNAELVGGAAIVKYLDPEYVNSITSLIEIQDNDSFEYKVFVKKSR